MADEKHYSLINIVILMSVFSMDGQVLADLPREQGIVVFFNSKRDSFEKREVEVFRKQSMLMVNPYQDLPLPTVLVNETFCFRRRS